jgi:hypothetical protein
MAARTTGRRLAVRRQRARKRLPATLASWDCRRPFVVVSQATSGGAPRAERRGNSRAAQFFYSDAIGGQ